MADTIADGLRHRLGLLVDLLQHERLETGLLRTFVVPVELDRLVLDGSPVGALERRASGPQRDDLAVVRELHGARLTEERRGVRGKEHLVRADSHD